MSDASLTEQLLAELDRCARLRTRVVEDALFRERRVLLRAWQAERLARTHGDLLQSKRFHDAVVFFLTDLYGPNDLSPHIEDLRRLVPLMVRTLPEAGVKAVAHAIELNALAEDLDGAMVEALDAQAAKISDPAYAAAYRKVGRAEDRERQIDLIALLGGALEALARQRFVGTALWAIRKPAQAAGFGDLQGFIERGYAAFAAMHGGAGEFVSIVVARERVLSKALLAGDDGALQRPPQG